MIGLSHSLSRLHETTRSGSAARRALHSPEGNQSAERREEGGSRLEDVGQKTRWFLTFYLGNPALLLAGWDQQSALQKLGDGD